MRVLIPLTALLAAVLAGCSQQTQKQAGKAVQAAAPVEIKVAAATARKVERAIAVTGSLLPDETVSLSFEVGGTISRILVDFGQNVRKGQLLAEIDRKDLNLQMERSRAALAQALARVGLGPDQENVNPESTPSIRQALAMYEDAKSKYEAAAKLVKTGDIAQERYTEVQKAFFAREAALQGTRDELRTQLAAISALRTELKIVQKRLADASLYAPYDGAIGARLASPGQYVKENMPVFTMVKSNPLRLRAEIPENVVDEVRVGTTLSFTTDAIPGAAFQAVVRELNPALDARSRSLTAEARLVESHTRLLPGMFVQVRLVVARDVDAVMVPASAVYAVAGLTKVFVIRDGLAVEQRVPPGQTVDGWVEVPADRVKVGDQVAVSRLDALVNGMKVQPRS